MAKIGLDHFKYSKLGESDKPTTPTSLGKAIDCKVNIETNTAELYADNALAESDYTFKKGTVSLGVDEDDDTVFAELLGHTKSMEDSEVVSKTDDAPPFVAIGRIVTKVVNGVYKYKTEILWKVKFHEPSIEETTKGENVEFKTPTIEGTVHALADKRWKTSKTFSTEQEAVTFLDTSLTGA